MSPCFPLASLCFRLLVCLALRSPTGNLAALLLSWQVISWRTIHGSWHQGTTSTHLNPDEASGRQGSAWIKCVWERSWQQWGNGDTFQGECLMPEEVLTSLRDHSPQVTYAGTERWKEKISAKPEEEVWLRKTSKRQGAAEKIKKQRMTERRSLECDPRLLCCNAGANFEGVSVTWGIKESWG